MKVSIIGLGWFGLALAKKLSQEGHEIFGTTRSLEKKEKLEKLGFKTSTLDIPYSPHQELFSADYLILNIPPREEHLSWLKSWKINKHQKIIFISSTSERPVLLEEEKWVQSHFHHWLILRFAGLVGPNRHPGKFLAGKKDLPGKNWPVNLLHLDDAVGFTIKAIRENIHSEIINVLSEDHRSRKEFYTYFSKVLNLPIPEFLESDESSKDPISSQRAKEIYEFKWPTISETSL